MKVIIYVPTPSTGGHYTSVITLYEGLKQEGLEVKIVANKRGETPLPEGTIYLNGGDPVRVMKIAKILNSEKPSVVVADMLGQIVNLFFARSILPRSLRKKIKFFGIMRNPIYRLKLKGLKKAPYRAFLRKVFSSLDATLAVSPTVERDLKEALNLDNIHVIYEPFDLEKISDLSKEPLDPKYEEFFKDHKILINVARFSPEKRLDLLLEAFAQIKRIRDDVRIVLVGGGREEEKLRKIVRDLHIERDVLFTGKTPNPYKYISRSDLFVLTSKTEGFGRVVVESLCVGTPVVAFANEFADYSFLIKDGENGFIVPYGDMQGLIEKILHILNLSEESIKKMRERCKISAKAFSKEKVVKEFLKLISSNIGGGKE